MFCACDRSVTMATETGLPAETRNDLTHNFLKQNGVSASRVKFPLRVCALPARAPRPSLSPASEEDGNKEGASNRYYALL